MLSEVNQQAVEGSREDLQCKFLDEEANQAVEEYIKKQGQG